MCGLSNCFWVSLLDNSSNWKQSKVWFWCNTNQKFAFSFFCLRHCFQLLLFIQLNAYVLSGYCVLGIMLGTEDILQTANPDLKHGVYNRMDFCYRLLWLWVCGHVSESWDDIIECSFLCDRTRPRTFYFKFQSLAHVKIKIGLTLGPMVRKSLTLNTAFLELCLKIMLYQRALWALCWRNYLIEINWIQNYILSVYYL